MEETKQGSLTLATELRAEIKKALPGPQKSRVLVLDDDEAISMVVTEALEMAGLECRACSTTSEGEKLLASFEPHAILLDYRIPESGAKAFVDSAAAKPFKQSIILVSATESIETVTRDLGLSAFLRKPFSIDQLYETLSRTLGVELQEAV